MTVVITAGEVTWTVAIPRCYQIMVIDEASVKSVVVRIPKESLEDTAIAILVSSRQP